MEQVQPQAKKPMGMLKKIGLIAAGIIVLLIVIGMLNPAPQAPGSSAVAGDVEGAGVPAAAALEVTAAELSKAYQENEARAQIAYEGKSLKVSGVVKDIDLSLGDEPIIKLKGSGEQYGMGVNADGKLTDVNIHGLTKQDAATLDKGKPRTFQCASVSEVMGSPQLKDCVAL